MAKWLDGRVKRRVAVHTSDGKSLLGVLVAAYPDVLVLRHARILDPGSDTPPALDGDAAVPRKNVSFVQVLPADGAGR